LLLQLQLLSTTITNLLLNSIQTREAHKINIDTGSGRHLVLVRSIINMNSENWNTTDIYTIYRTVRHAL